MNQYPTDIDSAPACSICGRQDESVRLVSFPYVFSILIMTFRRTFSGVWCEKHRNFYLALASLITTLFGWLGIPFGLFFTPIALFKLACGGDQPVAENIRLLKSIAEHKLGNGDPHGAILCYEQALKLGAKDARMRLGVLYKAHGLPVGPDGPKQSLRVASMALGAAGTGLAVGILESLIAIVLLPMFKTGVPFVLIVFSWAPMIALAFIGGQLVCRLVERGVTHLADSDSVLAGNAAILYIVLSLAGLPAGRAVMRYAYMLVSGGMLESTRDTLLTWGAVFTKGGAWVLQNMFEQGNLFGLIYLIILMLCCVYYAGMGMACAAQTVRWRQSVIAVREKLGMSVPVSQRAGWLTIVSVVGLVAVWLNLFPQQRSVDYFDAMVFVGQGIERWEISDVDGAVQALEQAVHLKPNLGVVRTSLGVAYLERLDYQAARAEFEAVIEMNPDDDQAHLGLGQTCFAQYRLDEAIAELERTVALNPQSSFAHLYLGLGYMRRGEIEQAIQQMEKIIDMRPDWGVPHAFLAAMYYRLDQLDLMEQEIQNTLALLTGDALTRYSLALLYDDLHRFSEAEAQLLEAIEVTPNAGYLYEELVSTYAAQNKFDLAFKACDKVSQVNKYGVDAYLARADVYIAQEKLDLALQELTAALERRSEEPGIYGTLSFVYLHQGQATRAVEMAKKALALYPYSSQWHRNLAFAHYDLGQLDPALAAAQRAVELDPKQDTARYILALCYLDKGEGEKAIAEFEQFLNLYWDRAYVRDYKAQAELYLSQMDIQ